MHAGHQPGQLCGRRLAHLGAAAIQRVRGAASCSGRASECIRRCRSAAAARQGALGKPAFGASAADSELHWTGPLTLHARLWLHVPKPSRPSSPRWARTTSSASCHWWLHSWGRRYDASHCSTGSALHTSLTPSRAQPYPARAAEVLSEEAAPEEGATAAQVPAEVSSAKPLFQSAKDDPTGGERDTSGRQAALQSVLCAAAPPVGERASSKGWAGGMSAVDAAVAPLAVSGADAPLTSDVQAAAAAELHRASVEQEEQAAAQAVLSAAKAAQVAKAAAGQAAVEAAAAAQREAQAAAPVTIAREEDAPVVAQTAAQHSQPAEEEEAEEEEPAESAPAAETLATDASEPEADASQSQGGDQVEAEGGSAAAAVPSLEDPLSAPPPPKAKKPKAKKQSATQ